MQWNRNPRSRMLGALALFAAAAGARSSPAGDVPSPERISTVADLGLRRSDVPVSTETKIVFLVNPLLNRPADLEAMLNAPLPLLTRLEGCRPGAFEPEEVKALAAPSRPGNTIAYDAVSEVAEQFFRHMFIQVPYTERTLHRIVQEVNREDFPLAVIDASPRVLVRSGGRMVETLVSVRLFMVHVASDRERGLRWVTRCELCFEDSAVGLAPFPRSREPRAALSASVLDALRKRIAFSFAHAPSLRRASGKIDEPRRELIERSISEELDPAVPPAAATTGERAPGELEGRKP